MYKRTILKTRRLILTQFRNCEYKIGIEDHAHFGERFFVIDFAWFALEIRLHKKGEYDEIHNPPK